MCCIPCGPRRSSGSRWDYHTPVEKITKAEVHDIIISGTYECFYKQGDDQEFKEYDGCRENLILILHDGKTRVKIAGSITLGYKTGYRTVVMKAPCVNATILLRQEK